MRDWNDGTTIWSQLTHNLTFNQKKAPVRFTIFFVTSDPEPAINVTSENVPSFLPTRQLQRQISLS